MTYEDALRQALREYNAEVVARRAAWLDEMRLVLDDLERLSRNRLEPAHAAATALQIEMQRDLLAYMPDPARIPDIDDGKRTSPAEPRRARDDTIAVVKFVEWVLFRKYHRPDAEIAAAFDRSRLDAATDAYCRTLFRLEKTVADLVRNSRPRVPKHSRPFLRLVEPPAD